MRLRLLLLGLCLVVCLSLTAAAGCGSASPASTTTTSTTAGAGGATSSAATTTTGAGGSTGSTTDATTGAGGATVTTTGQGGAGGAMQGDLGVLLIGEWKPTQFQNGNNPPEPAPPGSPYTIFVSGGGLKLACGQADAGTWVLDPSAPAPALATIDVTLGGGTMLSWYIVQLDTKTLVFAEGGDFFTFERSTCP